jgi:hypothetical protein
VAKGGIGEAAEREGGARQLSRQLSLRAKFGTRVVCQRPRRYGTRRIAGRATNASVASNPTSAGARDNGVRP